MATPVPVKCDPQRQPEVRHEFKRIHAQRGMTTNSLLTNTLDHLQTLHDTEWSDDCRYVNTNDVCCADRLSLIEYAMQAIKVLVVRNCMEEEIPDLRGAS